jgi:flagellar protein FliS
LIKAQRIISELQGNLNHDAGGEVSGTLQRLYEYYNRRLFEANLRKTEEPIAEVERLLGEIRNAWSEMLRQKDGPALATLNGAA